MWPPHKSNGTIQHRELLPELNSKTYREREATLHDICQRYLTRSGQNTPTSTHTQPSMHVNEMDVWYLDVSCLSLLSPPQSVHVTHLRGALMCEPPPLLVRALLVIYIHRVSSIIVTLTVVITVIVSHGRYRDMLDDHHLSIDVEIASQAPWPEFCNW